MNRGRRTESRLLFGSFCRSKKNKLVPFRELSIAWKACPIGAARSACFSAACGGYPCCYRNNHAASRHFPAAKPLKRSLSGTFHLLLNKQDKTRGVGRRTLPRKHAARAMKHRGFANLDSAHTDGGIIHAQKTASVIPKPFFYISAQKGQSSADPAVTTEKSACG